MTQLKILFYSLILTELFFFTLVFAEELTATSFILRDSALTILGGSTATSANFQNISAVGQVNISEATSTSFQTQLGILYFDLTTSTSEGAGGGGGGSSSGAGPAPPPAGIGLIKTIISFITGADGKKCSSVLTGDLNIDCQVNLHDFGIFLYAWDQKSDFNKQLVDKIIGFGFVSPDLDSDQKIDIKDLSILLSQWTN